MFNTDLMSLLVCPACKVNLCWKNCTLACQQCGQSYPILNGVPILINETNSIFSIRDYELQCNHSNLVHQVGSRLPKLEQWLRSVIPDICRNIPSASNFGKFEALLLEKTNQPIVLVIGAGIEGAEMSKILQNCTIRFVQTDVIMTPSIQIVLDGHDIPFKSEVIDGVIIQAVLEHVVDPYRVVQEIHRVLKPEGLVYAETPFMQQVHMGKYDFTRFTHLGHRRLFRNFEEIESGAACGAGSALAWTWEHFLLSFCGSSRSLRKVIALFVRFMLFGLPYLDKFTISTPGTLDAASSYYFLGAKSSLALSDRLLLQHYRGAQR